MTAGVAVIGTGLIGRDHVRRLMHRVPGVTVVAVQDRNPAAGRAVAAEFGCEVFDDARQMIRSDRVDAVVVASNDDSHAGYVLDCLALAKPVLCEKPLASTPQDAYRIVARESELGRQLVQVGFMRRFDPAYRRLKSVVDSGAIGLPLLVHAAHRNATHAPDQSTAGTLTNSGVHEIDTLRWLLGQDYSAGRVWCGRQNRAARPDRLRDPVMLWLETTSGIGCDVEINQNSGYGYDIRCEVVGEQGTVCLAQPREVEVQRSGFARRPVQQDWLGRFEAAYDAELVAWAATLAGPVVAGANAWDGYLAVSVAATLVSALNSGHAVEFDHPERPALYDRDEDST